MHNQCTITNVLMSSKLLKFQLPPDIMDEYPHLAYNETILYYIVIFDRQTHRYTGDEISNRGEKKLLHRQKPPKAARILEKQHDAVTFYSIWR